MLLLTMLKILRGPLVNPFHRETHLGNNIDIKNQAGSCMDCSIPPGSASFSKRSKIGASPLIMQARYFVVTMFRIGNCCIEIQNYNMNRIIGNFLNDSRCSCSIVSR